MVNWCAIWSLLSFSSINIDIQYQMYTASNPNPTRVTPQNITAETVDNTKNFVVLTHGWKAGGDVLWYKDTIESFKFYPNTVVIAADYRNAMSCFLYVGSVFNVKEVGDEVGEMLMALNNAGVPWTKIEVVGHSLGAHVAGRAGQFVKTKTAGVGQLERIFGLDPAGVLIPQLKFNEADRLTSGDAKRVIVFHTSLFGMDNALGHLDFYPNGGKNQGKCGTDHESDHVVATYYFSCSVNYACNNTGYKCQSYSSYTSNQCPNAETAKMSYNVENSAVDGSYYLKVTC